MANENELQLGMSVDTAEALANVKQFGAEFKRNTEEIKTKLAEASKTEFGKNLGEDFDGINVTVQDLVERLADLKVKFQQAPIGGEAWHRWAGEIKLIEGELRKAKDQFNQTNPIINTSRIQTGAFRTAITQSTYALGQFHPALGSAVSALNPMIYGLNTAAVRGQGFRAMLSAVGTQLVGPLGIITGIGILTTVITTLIRSKKEAVDVTKEYAGELQKLRSEVEKMSKATLDLALSGIMKQQSDLVSEVMRKGGELTEEQNKQAMLLKEQENILRNQLKTIGDINNLENERAELEEKIKSLRNIDASQGPLSPRNLELLKQYQNRVKEIEGTLDRIRGKQKKEKGEKEIFLSDEALLEKLKAVDEQLKRTNLSERERNILLAERLKIVNELNSLERERITRLIQRDIDASIADDDILFGDLSGDALAQSQRRSGILGNLAAPGDEKLREQIRLGGLLKQTLNDVKDAAGEAGRSLISAWTSNLQLLDRNTSMLQQFINEMFRAIAQAIILRLVTSFITGDGGFLSIIFGGGGNASAVPGIPSSPSLSKSIPTPGTSPFYQSAVSLTPQVVYVEGEISGRNMRLVQKKNNDYRYKYYGLKD